MLGLWSRDRTVNVGWGSDGISFDLASQLVHVSTGHSGGKNISLMVVIVSCVVGTLDNFIKAFHSTIIDISPLPTHLKPKRNMLETSNFA